MIFFLTRGTRLDSAALSCPVYVPPRKGVRGRSAGSFPEQRLEIEPTEARARYFLGDLQKSNGPPLSKDEWIAERKLHKCNKTCMLKKQQNNQLQKTNRQPNN